MRPYRDELTMYQKLSPVLIGVLLTLLTCSVSMNVYLYKQSYLSYIDMKPMPTIVEK